MLGHGRLDFSADVGKAPDLIGQCVQFGHASLDLIRRLGRHFFAGREIVACRKLLQQFVQLLTRIFANRVESLLSLGATRESGCGCWPAFRYIRQAVLSSPFSRA